MVKVAEKLLSQFYCDSYVRTDRDEQTLTDKVGLSLVAAHYGYGLGWRLSLKLCLGFLELILTCALGVRA
jgi:hypothetical protein